ncbi:ABC transporter permease [Rhodoferax fermentans]|uniref:Multidrug ABC transporter substrate-binding protein n=1 Tax=Rhodoferax fermentans TaxID=28066 RepID=A0A1T1AQ98_RHOFE|nr:FtsX-like permease family protein [Rhodoferax fermentans]MBK1685737.1 multidrug ABC transporter substrate-binding protein [Rhodoferax fermentans]OOV06138.1 multidrug ABC transporter substrate-binding protein [Rhodoferax fermentans]
MKTLWLAWRYLWARPLNSALNVLLLALGLASMTFLLLVGYQLEKAFDRDLAGIDVVVGAKGSPMQLILSGVLHVDVPTGNVPLKDIRELESHPQVAQIIPISLGDNFHAYRIVGTSINYIHHYNAQLAQGQLWTTPMQVVLGSTVARQLGLQLGQTFVGSHGLGAGGHVHGDSTYTVVGILQPSASVLDRLILTDTASVWKVHEDYTALDDEDRAVMEDEREITLALVRYKTPMAALTFPRYVNSSTDMQAAAPAVEITRLLHMLGLGTEVLRAFAAVLLLTAGLSVFIALWSAVRERRADLALLRMLGAPPRRVAALLLCEALWLGLLAGALGLLLGQGCTAALGWFLQLDSSLLVGGWVWPSDLLVVPALALLVSLGAALLPALGAYRVSVLELLQGR